MTDRLPHFDATAIGRLVSVGDAITALRRYFASPVHNIERLQVALGNMDDLLVMPALTERSIGLKAVTVISANPTRLLPLIQGCYQLFDRETGTPIATFDGSALTTLRTPAVSAIATDILADPAATTLGIVGTGVQARAHFHSLLAIRPSISTVLVAGRTRSAAERFVADLERAGPVCRAVSVQEAASAAIVCTCTSSATSVLRGQDVVDGSHVNLVGSYSPARREADSDLILRARIYVDDRSAAQAEAGDLIHAEAESEWTFTGISADLVELIAGPSHFHDPSAVTVFKSVGLAVEDLVLAELVYDLAGHVRPGFHTDAGFD